MTNIATVQHFAQFPAPYRITLLHDRVKAALSHLQNVKISIEPLVLQDDEQNFPDKQHDTARVWARCGTLQVNIRGVIDSGTFFYCAMTYQDDSPVDGFDGDLNTLNDVVAYVKSKF